MGDDGKRRLSHQALCVLSTVISSSERWDRLHIEEMNDEATVRPARSTPTADSAFCRAARSPVKMQRYTLLPLADFSDRMQNTLDMPTRARDLVRIRRIGKYTLMHLT